MSFFNVIFFFKLIFADFQQLKALFFVSTTMLYSVSLSLARLLRMLLFKIIISFELLWGWHFESLWKKKRKNSCTQKQISETRNISASRFFDAVMVQGEVNKGTGIYYENVGAVNGAQKPLSELIDTQIRFTDKMRSFQKIYIAALL